METTQLLLTAATTLAIALVGAMAVVPAALEAGSARGPLPSAPAAPRSRRPHGGRGHQGRADLRG